MLHRFHALLTLLLMLPAAAGAVDYKFEWEANHPNDGVVRYRCYFREPAENETFDCRVDGREKYCDGPTEGFTSAPYRETAQTTIEITGLPEKSMCFAVTAIDKSGYESDHSNQVCVRLKQVKIRR